MAVKNVSRNKKINSFSANYTNFTNKGTLFQYVNQTDLIR